MSNQVSITKSGYTSLKDELNQMQTVKRPALVERLSVARSMGDLAENSDYQSAKEELSFLDGSIAELEEVVQKAKVVTPTSNTKVELGHTVTVKLKSSQIQFKIVGEWEAKPSERKISASSPLGLALLNKTVGESVEVEAPAGKIMYTVVGIE